MYRSKADYKYLKLPDTVGLGGNIAPISAALGRAHTIRREDFAYLGEALLALYFADCPTANPWRAAWRAAFEKAYDPKIAFFQNFLEATKRFDFSAPSSASVDPIFDHEGPIVDGWLSGTIVSSQKNDAYIIERFFGASMGSLKLPDVDFDSGRFALDMLLPFYEWLSKVKMSLPFTLSAKNAFEAFKEPHIQGVWRKLNGSSTNLDQDLTATGARTMTSMNASSWLTTSGLVSCNRESAKYAYGWLDQGKVTFYAGESARRFWAMNFIRNLYAPSQYYAKVFECEKEAPGVFSTAAMFSRESADEVGAWADSLGGSVSLESMVLPMVAGYSFDLDAGNVS